MIKTLKLVPVVALSVILAGCAGTHDRASSGEPGVMEKIAYGFMVGVGAAADGVAEGNRMQSTYQQQSSDYRQQQDLYEIQDSLRQIEMQNNQLRMQIESSPQYYQY